MKQTKSPCNGCEPKESPDPPFNCHGENMGCADYAAYIKKCNTAKRNRRRGRRTENKAVKEMGATRGGLYGGEDGVHPIFSIEIKHLARFTGERIMLQAERNNKNNKIPLARVHLHRKPSGTDLIIMRYSDFEELYGGLK